MKMNSKKGIIYLVLTMVLILTLNACSKSDSNDTDKSEQVVTNVPEEHNADAVTPLPTQTPKEKMVEIKVGEKLVLKDFADVSINKLEFLSYDPDKLEESEKEFFYDTYKESYDKGLAYFNITINCTNNKDNNLTTDDFMKKDEGGKAIPFGYLLYDNEYKYNVYSFGDTILPLASQDIIFFGDIPIDVTNTDKSIYFIFSYAETTYKIELSAEQSEKDTLQTDMDKQKVDKKVNDDVTVMFSDMKSLPKDLDNGKYSETVEFEITVTNNLEKDIKGIQGIVNVKDMFDVSIIMIQCDLTDTVKAGETIVTDSLGMEINQFKDDHMKLYTSDYDDLIFEYKVNKIVFTDGTSKGE